MLAQIVMFADCWAHQASLRAALSTTPIRQLKLHIWCLDIPVKGRAFSKNPYALPLCLVEQYLQAADLGGLAKTFVDAISSLETMEIKVCGHRTRGRERYIASKDGSLVVVGDD